MDRYQNTLTIEENKGPSFYGTPITTEIPVEDIPFYYTAREGDRFDSLSNRFYNSPNYWWVIAKANKLVTGTMSIPAGTQLFIPNI